MESCAGSCAGVAVLGEGCDVGCDAGVSICLGEPEGTGVISGIFMSCCRGGTGGTPVGAGVVVGDGITMPGVCSWPAGIGIGVDLLAFSLCADALRLVFRLDLRLEVFFGFGLFIPGLIPDIV